MLGHELASLDHELLFIERYDRLLGWALQLTKHDQGQAEDVVHDAFIQFTYARPDLSGIENLDAYLYGMLRNIQISQFRRVSRGRVQQLSIIEYDSAALGLRVCDLHGWIQARDQLRRVCHYACARKESSKAGSVLILRFFHGYYPNEIAQILRSSRQTVDERLRIARAEAKLYLENPHLLSFIKENSINQVGNSGSAVSADELLVELRRIIFQSRKGDCLSKEELRMVYRVQGAAPHDSQALSHLVSCPLCLDEVNRLLGLVPLSERFPTDMMGPDAPPRDKTGSGSSRRHDVKTPITLLRRRAQEFFEHRPREIQISVNGEGVVSQKISGEMNELTLSIGADREIDFVEAFSEQDIRLLMLNVQPLPLGAERQSALIELSEGRTIEMILSFGSPSPTLRVIYCDPLLNAEFAQEQGMPEAEPDVYSLHCNGAGLDAEKKNTESLFETLRRFWRRFDSRFWLRPASLTAIVSIVLIAALLMARLWVPAASAAELLRRSTMADEALAARKDLVQHYIINFEGRKMSGGEAVTRRKIEVWRAAAQGVKTRRVYDENGQLIAGEWTKSDGSRTVYYRGIAPHQRSGSAEHSIKELVETDELWLSDLSAKEFAALIGQATNASVEERADLYLINYTNDSTDGGLLKAILKLNRSDLRSIEQMLLIKRGSEIYEYRFVEKTFEQHPVEKVSPIVFQPDAELLSAVKKADEKIKAQPGSTEAIEYSQAVASAELEVQVTYLLNRIKAGLGEQVSLTRTSGGRLRVEALVETAERKQDVLEALAPFINNPAIKIEVETVAEAVRHQKSSSGTTTLREVEVEKGAMAVDLDLRRYFADRLSQGRQIDQEINRFANRMMNHSRQALLQASALARLVKRFSPEATRALKPEAQDQWRSMINDHTEAYLREVRGLGRELQPIFFPTERLEARASEEGGNDRTDPVRLVERLLQLSYAHDEMMRSAFAISAEIRTGSSIKSPQSWRSLKTAEMMALEIQGLYQK